MNQQQNKQVHSFHIPVMGTGFSIDSPIKVAKYGISSVISLVDDVLIEQIRKYYCQLFKQDYTPIGNEEKDARAKRITSYLNLVNEIVEKDFTMLKNAPFDENSEIVKYFEMLPDDAELKKSYKEMQREPDAERKSALQDRLRKEIKPGSIDVNIMTKLDCDIYKNGEKQAPECSDAMSALRGYAKSDLASSVVFSAGINRKLYSYIEKFTDFFENSVGEMKKKITLKVSDYRSAETQGKMLAKKGIWVSEFRVESGLNCGGHAFPTQGKLLGPVLEEFNTRKEELVKYLHKIYNQARNRLNLNPSETPPETRITVQGGIGTAKEDRFLRKRYNVDGTGWGTPFLMVPEACSLDADTMDRLKKAKAEDLVISDVSPMGIPFNNLRTSASEENKQKRIRDGSPGSPCSKHFLAFNTEYSNIPVCVASKMYQGKKCREIDESSLPSAEKDKMKKRVLEKACICHELGHATLKKYNIPINKNGGAPAVCPGPNAAFFSKTFSLSEMIDHIYGKIDLMDPIRRSNMFVHELGMYFNYLKKEITDAVPLIQECNLRYLQGFAKNLVDGIQYYRDLVDQLSEETEQYKENMRKELYSLKKSLDEFFSLHESIFSSLAAAS